MTNLENAERIIKSMPPHVGLTHTCPILVRAIVAALSTKERETAEECVKIAYNHICRPSQKAEHDCTDMVATAIRSAFGGKG